MLTAKIIDKGEPKWVVALHGILASHEQIASIFTLHANIYAPDLPGHGESLSLNHEDIVGETAKHIIADLEQRGIKEYVLLGFSLGAYIALRMLRQGATPEKIIIVGGGRRLPHKGLFRKYNMVQKVTPLLTRHEDLVLRLTDVYRKVSRAGFSVKENVDVACALSYLEQLQEEDFKDACEKYAHPALIVHGKLDIFVPPSYGKELAKTFPQGVYKEFTGGHVVLSDDVTKEIEQFLS